MQRESGRIEEDSLQIPLHVKLRVSLTRVRVGVEISSLAGRRRGKEPNRGEINRGEKERRRERGGEKEMDYNPRDRAGNAIKAVLFRSLNRFPRTRRNVPLMDQ